MASNKKPRKKYVPKCRPGQLPVMIRFNEDDGRNLALLPHVELEKLRNGGQDEQHWHTITCRLNIGLVLAKKHFICEAENAIGVSLQTMVLIKERFERMGRWGASIHDLIIVHHGLVLVDDIQEATTRREQRDAIQEVFASVAQ